MTDTATTAAAADPTPEQLQADPLRFGVGARITVAVMTDAYIETITDALGALDTQGLVVETGDVSTYLGGDEARLLRAVTDLAESIAASGHHASVALHLSRGCPGEAVCEAPGGAGARSVEAPAPRETGRYAAAEWALYPLADQPVADGVEPDHMRDISAAIELARDNGTFRGSAHFVTRLEGDLGTVLGTIFAGWTMVGRTVQHVTCHATISLNSPSHTEASA
ncbi:hypothetical protein GCM10011490_01180 [Pseudoclavibacter endophyticus]|uniref:Thiamin/hydroxymethyl pyrimidine-binding YkoF putative domain-containing protein n=1 Tax=Pseudoclavibacter endophyticus TaxID=1778590 RepID=A0A6H9WTV0_9MICO|nr:YkoF family thiamine/hydroxymethylpyrimidine-binding protein [Pseudoclavibacter endophyticus]KAB1650327.1 hypothetical protein F8O04_09115 [Pseudoclavibacter endophyticus]GGA55121.1 hypothetical protein GCM10011490_01180 [Pseudoclavibacter endophyticus]